jgi:putative folate metabolism gamma-glutamate ligase
MLVTPIKTRSLIPPKDDLLLTLVESFSSYKLKERSIIVITSKVVSIWEGRCIEIGSIKKDDLIKQEADLWLDRTSPENVMLTIKNNILIPTSGIDESNANGYYILWPEKPFESAKKIYNFIKKTYGLKSFGVIISDSHTTPLRSGVMGIGIAYDGFCPLKDYRGTKDIFGRKLKMTRANIVDSLSASAVYAMGEGAEQTPIAIIEDVGDIKFGKFNFGKNNLLNINLDDDIYSPVLKSVKWKKGKNKK